METSKSPSTDQLIKKPQRSITPQKESVHFEEKDPPKPTPEPKPRLIGTGSAKAVKLQSKDNFQPKDDLQPKDYLLPKDDQSILKVVKPTQTGPPAAKNVSIKPESEENKKTPSNEPRLIGTGKLQSSAAKNVSIKSQSGENKKPARRTPPSPPPRKKQFKLKI